MQWKGTIMIKETPEKRGFDGHVSPSRGRARLTTFLAVAAWVASLAAVLETQARPEYAVRHGINQCTACHMSPAGGGPRNLNGKNYSTQPFERYEFAVAKYLSADARFLYFQTEAGASGRGGLGVMATNFAVHAPLDKKENLQLVVEQTLSGFAPVGRSAYLAHGFGQANVYGWAPQQLLIGRFQIPFGLMNDEHKTYVRQQSATTWNHFDGGFLAAADVTDSLHYDLGLLNGVRAAGAAAAVGGSAIWGAVVNMRWMPRTVPLLLGASSNYHQEVAGKESPWANSLYSIFSLDRATGERFHGSLMAEVSVAKNFNSLLQNFVSDANYLTSIANTQSRGLLLQAEWNITPRWALIYKYDEFIPDDQFMGDGYTRHGLGAKYILGPNMLLSLRVDKADATPLAEAQAKTKNFGATSVGWLQLQAAL